MYEKIDFHMQKFFGLSHFLIIFFQKMTQAKKVSITKNQFFMPVNHMKEFLKSVHNEALFSQLFSRTLIQMRSLNFKAKNLEMTKINSEFLNVSMVEPAPESRHVS